MSIGLYPGCSLKGSSREYRDSLLEVARALDMELPEVPDWNCCGATAAHNLNRDLALALPARVLALAEKQGMGELLVPCAACYSRLMVTRHELLEDSALRACISDLIGLEYRGTTQVLNIVQFLDKYVMDKIAERIVKPLQKRLACYYGCLLVRPPKVLGFDRPEDPQSLDNLVRRIGATPVEWAFKTECCGAGFSVSRTDLVAKLSSQILHDAESRGAEAVVVACPMCHSNLDMRRKSIERQAKRKYDLPVLYITQAIGLALGLSPKKLGLHRHMVPVKWQSAAAAEAGRPPNRE